MDMHEMALVAVDPKTAKKVLILNILLPGVGTALVGIKTKGDVLYNNIIVGLLQLVLTPFFMIGWIWSFILALQIYHKSHSENMPPQSSEKKYD